MSETVLEILERLKPSDISRDPLMIEFAENFPDAFFDLCEKYGGTKVSIVKTSTLVCRVMSREENERKGRGGQKS